MHPTAGALVARAVPLSWLWSFGLGHLLQHDHRAPDTSHVHAIQILNGRCACSRGAFTIFSVASPASLDVVLFRSSSTPYRIAGWAKAPTPPRNPPCFSSSYTAASGDDVPFRPQSSPVASHARSCGRASERHLSGAEVAAGLHENITGTRVKLAGEATARISAGRPYKGAFLAPNLAKRPDHCRTWQTTQATLIGTA